MPSVSTLPVMAVASPQAASSDNAVMSYVSSMIQQRVQLFATIEQLVIGEYQVISQEIARAAYSFQQQVDRLLGINPTPPNPSPSAAVTQPNSDSGAGRGNSSGAGSGTGAMTSGHNAANQALNNTRTQSGSGSGSGSSATSTHGNAAVQGSLKVHPMTGSGTGSATVYGHVWLDSNGDGLWDDNELGYYQDGVALDQVNPDGSYSTFKTALTDASGYYQITIPEDPVGHDYVISVGLPFDFQGTLEGYDSQIDWFGYSAEFHLSAGSVEQIQGGINSMNVTTTQDDAYDPIQNQVTLRDAMESGNNGRGPRVTFLTDPQGDPLEGTIALQYQLPFILADYDISGPGSSVLAVSGNNSWRIFYVQATSAIIGLTITSGYPQIGAGDGGGILNDGNLTLNDDVITNSRTAGVGGGISNQEGASLSLQQVTVNFNWAANGGGGIFNSGTVKIYDGVAITLNKSASSAAGIDNGGTLSAYSYVQITSNTNFGALGGGVVNFGKFQLLDGGLIWWNKSAGPGGGVDNSNGTMTLQGVTVKDNYSAVHGGGVYVGGGSLTLLDTTIYLNWASEGGGMYVAGSGDVKMTGGTIANNTATYTGVSGGGRMLSGGGGGLFVLSGTVTLSGTPINSNWSNFDGGGVYNSGGTLTLNDNINIGGNHAANQGGGMFLAGTPSTTNFNGVTVAHNVAQNLGQLGIPGVGVYEQLGAIVNPTPPNLTDNDDPNGRPVIGP